MDPSQRLLELFTRYVERRCEPQEVAELISLLEQGDAADALTEPMYQLWEELKGRPVQYNVDWDRMYNRISQVEADLSVLRRGRDRRRLFLRVGLAASVLFAVAGAGFWMMSRRDGEPVVAAAPGSVAVKRPDTGKRVIHLPDGSTVLLNTN